MEKRLPNLSFDDRIIRVIRPLDVTIVHFLGERTPFVLNAVVFKPNFKNTLVVFCQIALHPVDPWGSSKISSQNIVTFELLSQRESKSLLDLHFGAINKYGVAAFSLENIQLRVDPDFGVKSDDDILIHGLDHIVVHHVHRF